MKKLMTLALAAGMLLGATTGANAVDFKAKGWWQFGFGLGDGMMVKKVDGNRVDKGQDQFKARQRVRLQLDAVASEALSGTVFFEIGHQHWGKNSQGGAMGADGKEVKVRQAYLDWMIPETDLKIRMGIQNLNLPTAAGDGNVLHNTDTAAVVASYQFSEMVGLTAMWARPFNDNYSAGTKSNYLDNMDLFALTLPISLDGVKITPWIMYGVRGKNSLTNSDNNAGFRPANVSPVGEIGQRADDLLAPRLVGGTNTSKAWGNMFWAGLPIKANLDPVNIEFDFNYGYVEKMGRYDATYWNTADSKRASTKREGWLVKALVEYKMDWGTPGIFGWYASGDDSNVKNGSERMPFIYAETKFTSMMGEDVPYTGGWTDFKLSLDGSWGVGLQLKDLSFVEDLKHTIRVAYIGGTNDKKMARYAALSKDNDGYLYANTGSRFNSLGSSNQLYMTEKDSVVEVNLNTTYKIYDNMKMGLNLGYLFNNFDKSTWRKAGNHNSLKFKDAWMADLTFTYSF